MFIILMRCDSEISKTPLQSRFNIFISDFDYHPLIALLTEWRWPFSCIDKYAARTGLHSASHNSTFAHDWLMRFGCRNMEYRNVCQRVMSSVYKTHYICAHLPMSYIAFAQKGVQLCTFATVLHLLYTNWCFILIFQN